MFLRDAQQDNNMFLRLVDVDGRHKGSIPSIIWEHELWMGFEYQKLEPYFHSFESDVHITLNFNIYM